MARLAAEIWMLLLEFDVAPSFDYVPSDSNVADIFSRPDLVDSGDSLSSKYHWSKVDPTPYIRSISRRFRSSPKQAWATLWTSLYGGTRDHPRAR